MCVGMQCTVVVCIPRYVTCLLFVYGKHAKQFSKKGKMRTPYRMYVKREAHVPYMYLSWKGNTNLRAHKTNNLKLYG